MAKTTKTTKKPMRKATSKLPAALKAMENMVIATAECQQEGWRPAGSTTCSAVEQSARNQIGGGSILSRSEGMRTRLNSTSS